MAAEFDQELFKHLKAGLQELTDAEKRALFLIWRYPNMPVRMLPTMDDGEPSGSV